MMPTAIALQPGLGDPPATTIGLPLDITAVDAKTYRERRIVAYRNGDLTGAIADFDQAIQLDPKFGAAYIDRGIVFYRLQKFERAFADIARAKRIEKATRAKSPSPPQAPQSVAKKPPRPSQPLFESRMTPPPTDYIYENARQAGG